MPGFTAHVQDLDTVYKCFHKVPNDGVAPVSRPLDPLSSAAAPA